MNGFLRRATIGRLLSISGAAAAIAIGAAAGAQALVAGPTPAAKPLAQALQDALKSAPVEGLTAQIQYTDRLFEGIGLAGEHGGGLASSPLIQGANGRLWLQHGGALRLELQSAQGDTEIVLDHHLLTIYDVATKTVYHLKLPTIHGGEGKESLKSQQPAEGHTPSLAQIEKAIAHAERKAGLSGAQPANIAGQPAYTLRVTPLESGSLIGGLEFSWDANHGVPLRAAIYSAESQAPVIELAATEISYGAVPDSIFQINPPKSAKVVELGAHSSTTGVARPQKSTGTHAERPHFSHSGSGITSALIAQVKQQPGKSALALPATGSQLKNVGSTQVRELATELGTILTYQQGGIEYLLAGAVKPESLQALVPGH